MVHDHKPPDPSQDSASLIKRLAGPSVTKAGLATDQTVINRIIAEVSKGSKFYDNERRKDQELTERINKILKIRDDVLKEADILGVEAEADRLLDELEGERDLSQFIVHVDMDAFYASVELLRNPELAGKPFGVGKGVLCTASYEARKYGVRSGMAGFVAKKLCPELIFVPLDFEKYSEMSSKVMAIFKQYDPSMIVAGCDEGYLNITAYCEECDLSPDECVRRMREQVKSETKLTVSAGIAPNKMLAKICSDKNKPNGQFHMPFERETIKSFMRDLSIRKLPGVGRVNERLLESIGIKTCGDIYTHRGEIWLMDHYFGKAFLYKAYLGIASNVVQPHQREERKSIGAERTFSPIDSQEKILQKLEEVAVELESDMKDNGWAGKTVTLKYKLDTYQVFSRARSFNRWITKKDDLFNTGKDLIKTEFPLRLRLIGLRVTKLKDLRAPSDQGIKRFFQSASSCSKEPPTKKRKTEAMLISVNDDLENTFGDDDAMPGFHEHDVEAESWQNVDDAELLPDSTLHDEHLPIASSSKPISHADPCSSLPSDHHQPTSYNLNKMQPSEDVSHMQEKTDEKIDASSTQTCPLCRKELETDNLGLNAHIDFCLSKDAIKQATSSSSAANAKHSMSLVGWKEKRPGTGRKGKRK